MPGNRAIYDRAMDQSREASRQGRWDDALKSAVRALNEFPQEAEARTLAAVGLFNTNRLAQSLQIFNELRDPTRATPFTSTTSPAPKSRTAKLKPRYEAISR